MCVSKTVGLPVERHVVDRPVQLRITSHAPLPRTWSGVVGLAADEEERKKESAKLGDEGLL